MERICHKAKNQKEAEDWDIKQYIRMSPEERQDIAKKLRERIYGVTPVDVREYHRKQ